ncbi:hypothetical protein [Aquitalea sp.]|uniref:hypothetical protein n=1 Tax=Aquitalea sp. TaxID=1872623 RepID=UPI00258753A8|nr:hypothetical protein [Aquitalea sp.]
MKPASGRGMQCVRFGVVSSILLLLGGTWRNQNGLRFFFALRMHNPVQSSIFLRCMAFFCCCCGKKGRIPAPFQHCHLLCYTMV